MQALPLFVLAAALAATPAPMTGRVIHVADGDTVTVDAGGIHYTVRLIGVDAPERKGPGDEAEPFAREAALYAEAALRDRTVRLEFDRANAEAGHRDKYGRLLAYVSFGGVLFNGQIIREGYARAYRRFAYARKGEFLELEAEAKARGLGMWATPPAPPGGTVYITSSGTKYHRDGCRFLDRSGVEVNVERAIDLGYEPCGVCRPGEQGGGGR